MHNTPVAPQYQTINPDRLKISFTPHAGADIFPAITITHLLPQK